MQDRFKFRVWSKIYNFFVDVLGVEQIYRSKYFPVWQKGGLLGMHKQDDVVTEQCTGLKDKNGKVIFEGDILKDKDGLVCFVVWFAGAFWVETPGSESRDFECSEFYNSSEIIGNIHETPELLEA